MTASVPPVSVIVPTFNRKAFALEAVASVLGQTRGDLEVLVIDDGSEDGTEEAFASHADPRVRYVRKEHSGIAATRNRGIAEARGRILGFLDSDDLWVPDKLEKQLPLLQGNVGFVYARYRSVRDGRILRSKPVGGPSGRIFLALLCRIFVQTSTALVAREAVEATGPFDESLAYADEYEFFLRLAERYPVGFVDEDLVIYRIHGGNESRDRRRQVSENLEVYRRFHARTDLSRRAHRTAGGRMARYAVQLGRPLFEEGCLGEAAECFREALSVRPLSLSARAGLWKARRG
ncbi:MAG: glycosyltransferase [Planctomycetota bacterium]|jgi:glycosyltransferase involved in cell wall biosynthesis